MMEPKAYKELKAYRAYKVLKDLLVQTVLKELKAYRAYKELRVSKVLRER
jgi:hypothetical protein